MPGKVLGRAWGTWQWKGKPAWGNMLYYYSPLETAPPAAAQPEELAAQAIRDAESRLRRVDAMLVNFDSHERARVAGVISGSDFDLTVKKRDALPLRQIAVGRDFWTSTDGGATWRKQNDVDRSYFNEVDFGEMDKTRGWPRQIVMEKVDGGAGSGDDGELALLRRKDAAPVNEINPLNYWVAMKNGKPVLRRVETMAMEGLAAVYEMIDDMPKEAGKVLPPPGNPAAVPGPGGEELIAQAIAAMKTAGLWKADVTVRKGDELSWHVHGLIAPPFGIPTLRWRILRRSIRSPPRGRSRWTRSCGSKGPAGIGRKWTPKILRQTHPTG